MPITTIGFDADDTLWQNEAFFRLTQERFAQLLSDSDPAHLTERLEAAERRNLGHYGFGIKGFMLSMIETAIEVTQGRVAAPVIAEILAAGLRVVCRVLAVFATDAEAFKAERQFIAAHADLTNANAGGGGSWAGATRQDGERQESPEVTKRDALDLLSRIVPYVDWLNEKARTNEESDTYMSVVADLRSIIAMCDSQLSAA